MIKKIIGLIFPIVLFTANFSFAIVPCEWLCDPVTQTCNITTNQCEDLLPPNGWGQNPTWGNTNNPWQTASESVMGISCSQEQLVQGQCKLNIYDTLGIRNTARNPGESTSVGLFVQDIVLSATMFIGTLVTVALIVSGLMYIFAASSGKDPANAKKGIIGSLVGLLIVVSSYVIIRLVQYIAKWF